jgi:hypothetical protein
VTSPPSTPTGSGSLTLIGSELQRQEEGLRLVRQLKSELSKLTTSLHAILDGHSEGHAAELKAMMAAIYTSLLSLAALRPAPADTVRDPVYEIGTAVRSLDPRRLDDSHATADALTRIETAIDRCNALAADFCWDGRQTSTPDPLSSAVGTLLGSAPTAPRSGADALHLAKTVADGLRAVPGSIGTSQVLSAEA